MFSFFFIHFVGICPVEGVNCPPVRAKPKIIRRNAIRKKRFLIHLAESRLQLFAIARSAGPACHPTDCIQSGRRCVGRSQDVIETLSIKSRFNVSSTKFLEI